MDCGARRGQLLGLPFEAVRLLLQVGAGCTQCTLMHLILAAGSAVQQLLGGVLLLLNIRVSG